MTARWRDVLSKSMPDILTSTLIAALSLGVCLALYYLAQVHMGYLTRDVTTLGEVPIYYGFVSQLGLFAWSGAVAVSFFTATSGRILERRAKSYIVALGLFSLHLLLDDAFMLHEFLYPSLGIPEEATYLSYIAMVGLMLSVFRGVVPQTPLALLFLSLCGMGTSVVSDVLIHVKAVMEVLNFTLLFIIEDFSKFAGALLWAAYVARTSLAFMSAPGSPAPQ